jgi:UDP-N-acetylmuramyl tripeptide synthase
MGQIVSEYSDLVILTEDDNYTEDVHTIMKDIIP